MDIDKYEGQFVIVTLACGTVRRGILTLGKDNASDQVIVGRQSEMHIFPVSEIERIEPIGLA